MVDYIGIERVRELVARVGTGRFIAGLATEIEADYRRWREFEKSPRHASHSPVGVIELMPTSDGTPVLIQVRQRPPQEHRGRTADGHRVRRVGRRRYWLSIAAVGTDVHARHCAPRPRRRLPRAGWPGRRAA